MTVDEFVTLNMYAHCLIKHTSTSAAVGLYESMSLIIHQVMVQKQQKQTWKRNNKNLTNLAVD